MMLCLVSLSFMVSCYLKLKPSVLRATEEINGQDNNQWPAGYCKFSMTMLTFPVMLTSQCCYDPLREDLRYSNMFFNGNYETTESLNI